MTLELERPDPPGGLVLERPDQDWTRDQYGRPRILPDPLWVVDPLLDVNDPPEPYPAPASWLDAHGDLLPSRPYTRVTTFGEALQDSSALTRWKMRRVLLGASRRPDYVTGAAALTADDRDKAALNDLAEKCLEAAGPNAADLGTALHGFTERLDRGEPLGVVPEQYRADVEAYRAATEGFRWIQRECRMVCDELETAGTPDGIADVPLADPDGVVARRITDLKTGQVDYSASKFATQLAIYSRSHLYDPATGERTPVEVDQRWGLIVHAPVGAGRADLLWIDLAHGWAGALLCAPVREWRAAKAEQLLVPVGGRPQPATCTGVLASGAPCTARAKQQGLCGRHQAQAVTVVQDAAAGPVEVPGPSTAVDEAVEREAQLLDSAFPEGAGPEAVAAFLAEQTPQQEAACRWAHGEQADLDARGRCRICSEDDAPEQNGNPTPVASLTDPDTAAESEREAEAALLAMIGRTLAPTELDLLWQSTHQQWTPAVKYAASTRREYLERAPQAELQSAALLASIAAVGSKAELLELWDSPGVDQVWTQVHTDAARARLEALHQ